MFCWNVYRTWAMKGCTGIDKTPVWSYSWFISHMMLIATVKETSLRGTGSLERSGSISPWFWSLLKHTRHLCTSVPAVYPQLYTATSFLHKNSRQKGSDSTFCLMLPSMSHFCHLEIGGQERGTSLHLHIRKKQKTKIKHRICSVLHNPKD